MWRRTACLLLATLGLTCALAGGVQADGPDVVAAEPLDGDRGAYEGYEAVYTSTGEVLDNRSLDHQRTWTTTRFPLPSGEAVPLATLQHRYPAPEPASSSSATADDRTPSVPSMLEGLRAASEEEGPAASRDVIESDVHHERVPSTPDAFSAATLTQHHEDRFWRIFRLHAIAEGWCAQDPTGAFAGLPAEALADQAEVCMGQAPWGEVREAEVSTAQDPHPEWGHTWRIHAAITYRTAADEPGRADVHVRFAPHLSMALEQTVIRQEPSPEGPSLTVRHAEMVGFERGEGSLASAEIPEQEDIEHVLWTSEGPEDDWDPELSYEQAREAVNRDPRVEAYREDNANARVSYLQFTRLREEASASEGTLPGNCDPIGPSAPGADGSLPEAAWTFQLSGEREDQMAHAERRAVGALDGDRLQRPARVETSRFASPDLAPGLDLPREGPSPSQMFEIATSPVRDESGHPFVAVLPPGDEGSTSVGEDEPLIGAAGRVHCTVDPLDTYSYENEGVAVRKGRLAGVFTLRVEAVQDQGTGIAELSSPPASGDGDEGLPTGGLTGLALAATGVAGWAGTRMLGSLYSRIRDRDLLDHEVRAAVHDAICASPGTCLPEIAEGVDRHRSTVAYHLDRLEEGRLIETRVTSSGRIAFPVDHPLVDAAETLARARARELVSLVRNEPGRALSRYAETLDVSKSYVSRLARDLASEGLLERRREGRCLLLAPGPRARALASR